MANRIVMKFGGSSLADASLIRAAALRVSEKVNGGAEVLVVVSAMGHETDRLLSLAGELSGASHHAELDIVLAAGEQISAGLMSLALLELGCASRSFLAHELPILSDGAAGNARIEKIESRPLLAAFAEGKIPVVAGFQGVAPNGRLVTLGRGGSDTTAVALAVAIEAECCEFYKDVRGVHAADPHRFPEAVKHDFLTFEEMATMASQGAEVLHGAAVQFAARHALPLHLRSAFHGGEGTWIGAARKQFKNITPLKERFA